MRTIYLLAGAVLLASTAMAQQTAPRATRLVPAALATDPSSVTRVVEQPAYRAGGDTIWIDEFEDPSMWTASASDAPDESGWSIGTQTNSWFFNNQDMGTSGNFARMRNGTPPPTAPNPLESAYSLTYNGSIDLTDVPAPHLEFEQFGARFIENQAVQVSTDGGDTWVTVGDNFDITPLTAGGGAQYPKPMTRRYNIVSAIADDPSNVQVRLFWDGAENGPAINYIMYGWYVDNIRIVEGFDNDMAIESYASYTDYETTGIFEFGIWPQSLVTEVDMAVRARNSGASDQVGLTLGVQINGEDAAATLVPTDIIAGASDTVRTLAYSIPSTIGDYTVDMTVVLDGVEDDNPDDNSATQSFSVSEFLFARDNTELTGQFPAATYEGEFQFANGFQFFSAATVYAIDVVFTAGDNNAEVQGYVLDGNLDIIANSEELALHPAIINSPTAENLVWATLRLEDPFEAEAEFFYAASVGSFGAESVRIATSQDVPDQTCFVYGDFGTAGFDWYFTNSAGMVRFNLDPNAQTSVSVAEINANQAFTLFQNIPNPAAESTRIAYTLEQAAKVSFEVMDITGKRVFATDMGMLPAGPQQFDLNVSDFAPGMYTYTINVNGERATRKMIVE